MSTTAPLPRPKLNELLSRSHWQGFAAVVWRRRWSLAIVLAIVTGIHGSGVLRRFDLPVLDTWLSTMSGVPAVSVRIVAISRDEFEKLWADPRRRAQSLKIWLETIAKSQPRVIGVDLTTASADFASLADLGTRLGMPIVWARNADVDKSNPNVVVPHAAIGGASIKPPARTGIALGIEDDDGVVRELPRLFETAAGPRPSFHLAVVDAACQSALRASICSDQRYRTQFLPAERLLNPYRQRVELAPISVTALLDMAATGSLSVFRDRIVLFGIVAPQARDTHQTPLGKLVGVEIWAHAIESELEGRGLEKLPKPWLIAIEVVIALTMLWVHHFVGGKLAVVLNVVAAPVLMILASFLVFRVLGLMLMFAPVTVGILIHQLHEDYRRA